MTLYKNLQEDVYEWSEENFPDQPDVNPFLGSAEEAGELADDLNLDSQPNELELDAVGDIIVYLADFCGRRGLDLEKARTTARDRTPEHDNFFREWLASRGQLTRSVLKRRQGIRMDEDRVGEQAEQEALSRMFAALDMLAETRGYTLEECVRVAWDDEVIDREWDSSYKN